LILSASALVTVVVPAPVSANKKGPRFTVSLHVMIRQAAKLILCRRHLLRENLLNEYRGTPFPPLALASVASASNHYVPIRHGSGVSSYDLFTSAKWTLLHNTPPLRRRHVYGAGQNKLPAQDNFRPKHGPRIAAQALQFDDRQLQRLIAISMIEKSRFLFGKVGSL
jgi:hypothetical protein